MRKEIIGKGKMLFAILAVAIIIIASFTVINQFQLNDLASSKQGELFVKVFADTDEGVVPLTVNFSSIAFNYEGKIKYYWDFGDGTTSEKIMASHTYETNDTYICKLKIVDENKDESSDWIEINVKGNSAPVGTFKITPQVSSRPYISIIPALSKTYAERFVYNLLNSPIPTPRLSKLEGWVTCEADFEDPEGDEIASYTWDIYPPSFNQNSFLGGEVVQPHFQYIGKMVTLEGKDTYRAGLYNVILTVEDSEGNNASYYATFKIDNSNQRSKILGAQATYTVVKDNWLKLISKKALGIFIAGLIISKIADLKGIPLVKVVILLLLGWQLNINPEDGTIYIQLFAEYLEKHPIIANTLDKILVLLYNLTDRENLEILREQLNLGDSNKRPVIKDQYPAQEAYNIARDTPYVQITVDDLHLDSDGKIPNGENNTFTVTINGDYIDKDVYIYPDVLTGNFKAYFNTSLLPDNKLPPIEEINWNVKVVDFQGDVVEPENGFKFTTSLV